MRACQSIKGISVQTMTGKLLTIDLPLPPATLHAHTKGHWQAKAKSAKSMRELACGLSLQSLGRCKKPRMQAAVISFRVFVPDNLRRDVLNIIHGLKPAIDGIVDAGVLKDDSWQVLAIGSIVCAIDKTRPRIEITVKAIE